MPLPCSHCEAEGARKLWLFPWIEKQKESADFFFFFLRKATNFFKTRDKQTHLITQFEKSSQSVRYQELSSAQHTRTATDHWGSVIWDEWLCERDLVGLHEMEWQRVTAPGEWNLGSPGGRREPRLENTSDTKRSRGRVSVIETFYRLERDVHSCMTFREWTDWPTRAAGRRQGIHLMHKNLYLLKMVILTILCKFPKSLYLSLFCVSRGNLFYLALVYGSTKKKGWLWSTSHLDIKPSVWQMCNLTLTIWHVLVYVTVVHYSLLYTDWSQTLKHVQLMSGLLHGVLEVI